MSFSAWSVIAGEVPTVAKWNILGSNDADANTRIEALEIGVKPYETAADGATITFDLATGDFFTSTLGGNRTLAVSNPTTKQRFAVRLKQPDAGGPYTVTWFSGIHWPYNVAPTLSTVAKYVDIFTFVCVGSGVYDNVGQQIGVYYA